MNFTINNIDHELHILATRLQESIHPVEANGQISITAAQSEPIQITCRPLAEASERVFAYTLAIAGITRAIGYSSSKVKRVVLSELLYHVVKPGDSSVKQIQKIHIACNKGQIINLDIFDWSKTDRPVLRKEVDFHNIIDEGFKEALTLDDRHKKTAILKLFDKPRGLFLRRIVLAFHVPMDSTSHPPLTVDRFVGKEDASLCLKRKTGSGMAETLVEVFRKAKAARDLAFERKVEEERKLKDQEAKIRQQIEVYAKEEKQFSLQASVAITQRETLAREVKALGPSGG